MALSINNIKYLKSLGLKKFRQKYNKFSVEGDKIAKELLIQSAIAIDAIYALPSWVDTNAQKLSNFKDKTFPISEQELNRISNFKTPNEVFVVCETPVFRLSDAMNRPGKVWLYLDEIRDPGNLGTIIRTADWFGVDHLFCSENCAEVYNPKTIQATMGSFTRVETHTCALQQLVEMVPERQVIGAMMDGIPLNELHFQENQTYLLVVGSESHGISVENQQFIQKKVTIPRGQGRQAESLNAAIATGIFLSKIG